MSRAVVAEVLGTCLDLEGVRTRVRLRVPGRKESYFWTSRKDMRRGQVLRVGFSSRARTGELEGARVLGLESWSPRARGEAAAQAELRAFLLDFRIRCGCRGGVVEVMGLRVEVEASDRAWFRVVRSGSEEAVTHHAFVRDAAAEVWKLRKEAGEP